MKTYNKPFIIPRVEEAPLKRFKNILTKEINQDNLKKELDSIFKLIGEEFKRLKNCKLYKFFTELDEKDQKKIIDFLKNIINENKS